MTLADHGIQAGGEGIVQGFPQQAGVEGLFFNGFSVGTNPFSLLQWNRNYDLSDSVSRTAGNHAFKVGGRYIWFRVTQTPNLVANGTYSFFASGSQSTGNDYADFLLGLPDYYSQQSSPPFYESASDGDLFAEDSFRVRPNLTLNYGVRWDYVTPWAERHHQISTLIEGVQSATFRVLRSTMWCRAILCRVAARFRRASPPRRRITSHRASAWHIRLRCPIARLKAVREASCGAFTPGREVRPIRSVGPEHTCAELP